MKKHNYNITQLHPDKCFERHIFHRDQFAHYLRWTHILKESNIGETIVDFGCGKGNLLEVLYRNRKKQSNTKIFNVTTTKELVEKRVILQRT